MDRVNKQPGFIARQVADFKAWNLKHDLGIDKPTMHLDYDYLNDDLHHELPQSGYSPLPNDGGDANAPKSSKWDWTRTCGMDRGLSALWNEPAFVSSRLPKDGEGLLKLRGIDNFTMRGAKVGEFIADVIFVGAGRATNLLLTGASKALACFSSESVATLKGSKAGIASAVINLVGRMTRGVCGAVGAFIGFVIGCLFNIVAGAFLGVGLICVTIIGAGSLAKEKGKEVFFASVDRGMAVCHLSDEQQDAELDSPRGTRAASTRNGGTQRVLVPLPKVEGDDQVDGGDSL